MSNASMPKWVAEAVSSHVLAIPPYEPGKPIEELQRERGIADAIKMASNENPLGPSPRAMKAARAFLGNVHRYPESSAPVLRSALASHWDVPPERIILANGSDEVLTLAAHVFIRPGDEAVMPASAFSMYRIVLDAFGGQPVRVPLQSYRIDLEALAAAVTDRTRLVFVTVPHSPTGTVVSRGEMERFLDLLPKERLILVVDEAYREYVADTDCPHGIDYLEADVPVLVLRTFSKIYGLAGLRVGYGLGPEWLIELLNRVRSPFNVNSVAQIAAAAALEDVVHVEKSKAVTRAGILRLTEELKALSLEVIPSQANFVTFRVGQNARPLYEALLNEGVIVRHLASFGMTEFIRVSVGTEQENSRFLAALKKAMKRG